ncbi:uroporphyrinogen-III C-methyltransferase [Microbulbifer guangxiensis]|uniref:uroporphyrinogen-III C-methyltransferase n=1 Tax=Microbulbifer guangxiensis TaxID=2904249 RepID=UPI001F3834D3|nr:uroporphyrinogen-III C-methyltransferase [Microbulbifer guangxiensis]
MTDKKSAKPETNPASGKDVPTVTEKAEPKSNFAKAKQDRGSKPSAKKSAPPKKGGLGWLWLLLTVLILGGGGAWAWYNVPQVQQGFAELRARLPGGDQPDRNDQAANGTGSQASAAPEQAPTVTPAERGDTAAPTTPPPDPAPAAPGTREPLTTTQPSTPTGNARQERVEQAAAALAQEVERQDQVIAELQQQLARMQRALNAQAGRLSELGNVSRQDWQLAEADYLLRLANQRLLLERDSRAALGLLEEVDTILRRVDLPDLYAVRQQLARDLTALKLVDNIDREGIFLRLRALEEQLLRTDIQPEFDLATRDTSELVAGEASGEQGPVERSWDNFLRFMQESVRIRDGDIDPVLLSPQSEARFRQSLRLNMEQAELALLRENGTVFRDSLLRARKLLLDYGIPSHQREVLAGELQKLSQLDIEVELPSLAASQSALHNYIEQLHKTESVEPVEREGETP